MRPLHISSPSLPSGAQIESCIDLKQGGSEITGRLYAPHVGIEPTQSDSIKGTHSNPFATQKGKIFLSTMFLTLQQFIFQFKVSIQEVQGNILR